MKDNKIARTKEDLEILRNRKQLELSILNQQIKEEKRRKTLGISISVIIVIIILRLVFGTIEIPNIAGYPKSKAKYYKVMVNDTQVTVNYTTINKIPIVPFLVNFNSVYLGTSNMVDVHNLIFKAEKSEKYELKISSYNCYINKTQVECKYDNQTMKIDNNLKYTKLKITRITNPWEEVYNGPFIKDFTKYVKEKGEYCIEITAEKFLTKTEVYFYFDVE